MCLNVKRIILISLILLLLVGCSANDPGDCSLYRDEDGNQICDLSE